MPQASPVIPLLRKAYPGSFATQPDVNVRDYFYRLMFEPVSFGDARQGQAFRRQVLSDMKRLAQNAMPGVTPPSDREFVVWARKQALGMAPEKPAELRAKQEFSRKAFQYEQRFGDLAHPILFTEEFAKNLFGKPAASLISLASIIPGAPREATQAVADAISPRIEFGQHVTEKYGQVAGLAYTFGEALAGFGPVAGAAKLGAGLTAATRIPGISQMAGAIARNETLFNTLFFGSYSAGEYNRAMLEQGKKPTAGGFAANLGAGMALGYMFPKAKEVFASAKAAKPWVNTVLAPMLKKKVADIKAMSPAELRVELLKKFAKKPLDKMTRVELRKLRQEIVQAARNVRFVKAYKGSIASELLKQSTKAGVLGAATGGVSQMTQGIPIDMPSLIQNAVFMMGFHAHGIAGAFGKPLGKAKPGKVEDGVLKLDAPGHRRKLIDAFKPFFEEPDIAPERGITEFARILRETYGVEKIEVEKGEFRSIDDFLGLVDPANLPEKTKAVIGRIGRARAEKDFLLASKEEAQLDSYLAQIARAKGESPTEVPFSEPGVADVPTAKKAQTMYMWLHELIGNNVGREAQDAFRRGLGTDTSLSERATTEPEVARILEQFPAAEAVERLFDATVRGLEVSPELWGAAKMFTVPHGLLKAGPERQLLPRGREKAPPERPPPEVIPRSVDHLKEIIGDKPYIRTGNVVVVHVGERTRPDGTTAQLYKAYKIDKPIGSEILPGIRAGETLEGSALKEHKLHVPRDISKEWTFESTEEYKKALEKWSKEVQEKREAEEIPPEPALAEMFPTPKSVGDLRDTGLISKGAKVAEKDGVVVAEKGRGVISIDPKTGKPTEGMLYDVFQIGKSIGEEITPEITSGSTVSEAKIRKFGFPIPGEKVAPPVEKPKPVIKPKDEAPVTIMKLDERTLSRLDKEYGEYFEKVQKDLGDVEALQYSKQQFTGRFKELPYAKDAEKAVKIFRAAEKTFWVEKKTELDIDDVLGVKIRAGKLTPSAKPKPKPEEVRPTVAKRKVKAPTTEEAQELLTLARMIGPVTGVNRVDVTIATSPETLPRVLKTAKRLGVKTKLDDPLKLDPQERQAEVNKVYQAITRAVHSSTREPGDVVTFKDDFGIVIGYNPKKLEYRILSLITGKTNTEKWHLLDRIPDEKVVRQHKTAITRGLTATGFSAKEVADLMSRLRGDANRLFSTPVDTEYLADLAGAKKEQMLAAMRGNPSLADKLGEMGRMLHTFNSTRDPFLMHLSRFLFYGDPEKLMTPRQWNWINKAVEFNRTNPYMNDGRGGTINAADFVQTVLGRRNYHPELAKEGGQPFEPMTRDDARLVLQNYARISEAIRDRNWPLALKVFLPVALKKYSPRVERRWDELAGYENDINGVKAETDREVHGWNAKIGKGDKINPKTQTEKFRAYNNKHYGYIWELARKHGWMPEGKENRWGDGRTHAQEIHGLVVGKIPWNEPFVSQEALDIARSMTEKRPVLTPAGYTQRISMRDGWWHFLNNGLKRYEYPRIRGLLHTQPDYFREAYTHWKMQSEKTTPENSEAMKVKFQKEADKILTNEKRKIETINVIMESKKLGKIVDIKGRNAHYPFFDPKLPEKLLEAETMIEEGKLPSGALGKLMHAQHRRATIEYHIATGEFDPVRDITAYVNNMTSYLWRAAVRTNTWRGIKDIRLDIERHPQYAQLFQRHIEIMEKLRGDLLDRQDGALNRLSQNTGLMASAIMLAHPKTITRNVAGGLALLIIHNGLKDFGAGWRFIRTPFGKQVVDRAGHEAGALFSEAVMQTADPRKLRLALTKGMNANDVAQVDKIVRMISSYALTRPLPFVTDLIPGLQDAVKGISFAGTEVLLRNISYATGFQSGVRRVIEAPKKQNKARVIYGNSPKEIQARIEKQYVEIEITPDDVLTGIKKNPAKFKGAKKFMLKVVGPETNAEQRARAYRTGIQEGAKSVMMTQFIYSNLNTPAVMKHPLGRVVLLFRKYTWNRFNFASTVIKEAMPQRGGGPEEFARLMRFAIALSAAKAIGAYIGFNLYRFVEDDVVSMLASINDWFSEDPDKRKQATFGKPAWQFLTGAEFSRNIDVLINADMPTWEKVLTVSHLPYSRAAVDAYREHLKVTEKRKNVYEALMNFHFGLYRYNYGGTSRRRRAGRPSR